MSDDYISFEEAANYLDVDVVTFGRLVKSSGPLIRIERGQRQISRAELDALVQGCRIQPGTLGSNNQRASRTRQARRG